MLLRTARRPPQLTANLTADVSAGCRVEGGVADRLSWSLPVPLVPRPQWDDGRAAATQSARVAGGGRAAAGGAERAARRRRRRPPAAAAGRRRPGQLSRTIAEIANHGHVLTPGRYVGAEDAEADDEPFTEKYPQLVAVVEECLAEGERLNWDSRSIRSCRARTLARCACLRTGRRDATARAASFESLIVRRFFGFLGVAGFSGSRRNLQPV